MRRVKHGLPSLEAAKLRQAAAIPTQVGREISREAGQGMRIRF